jgi:hypothetical protein
LERRRRRLDEVYLVFLACISDSDLLVHKFNAMTIEIFKDLKYVRYIESNNVPRVGDDWFGLEVTNVEWNDDLSGVKVYIGKRLFWTTIKTPEDAFYVGLDSMPVVDDYVEIPDRYLVDKCVISEQETVCFAKRIL